MEGNAREFLSLLSNPQNPLFPEINKHVSESIMNHNEAFLQEIIKVFTTDQLTGTELWNGFSIIKQYFDTSVTYDPYHDAFPSSTYPPERINFFRQFAFRFFTSKLKPLRCNAVEFFFQTVKVSMELSTQVYSFLLNHFSNPNTPYEMVLSIIQFFVYIYSEFELDQQMLIQLFVDLCRWNNQYSEDIEFRTAFFKILAQFTFNVFSCIQNEALFKQFLQSVINDYQQKPELKTPILEFLRSSVVEPDALFPLMNIFIPLLHSDLQQFLQNNLNKTTALKIMEFINFLYDLFPNFFELFLKAFLPLYLLISQTFPLNNDIAFFDPTENEPYLAAIDFYITLLRNPETSAQIYEAVYPYISEGILNENLNYRGSVMLLLSYTMCFLDKAIAKQTIDISVLLQCLTQTLNSEFCHIRYFSLQVLFSTIQLFPDVQLYLPFIDCLFYMINDAERIALLALSTLRLISENEKFENLDSYFQTITTLLTPESIFANSQVSSQIVQLFHFAEKHISYLEPSLQYLNSLLCATLTIPEEQLVNVDLELLMQICAEISTYLFLLDGSTAVSVSNEWIELALAVYQKFHLGSDLVMISPFLKFNEIPLASNLQMLTTLLLDGFQNLAKIHSLFSFVTFVAACDETIDLLDFKYTIIENYIEIFNFTNAIQTKNQILSSFIAMINQKSDLFTKEVCSKFEVFLIEISGGVCTVVSLFDSDDYVPFYRLVCRLFKVCIVKTAFKDEPTFFEIVNQFISSILDFQFIFEQLLNELKELTNIALNTLQYKPVIDVILKMPIYRNKYALLTDQVQSIEE